MDMTESLTDSSIVAIVNSLPSVSSTDILDKGGEVQYIQTWYLSRTR